MKSRTSFFDKTLLKKDLTRFAPLWGLYLVALFMGMLLMLDSGTEYWFAANLAGCIQFMPVVNLCYGIVAAQLLFGDLYNARMCNALHAFPVKRETQFFTHILSGLLFSLVPTAVFTAVSLPLAMLSNVIAAWQLPLWWYVGANLQYIFFFALGVFSVLCSGNRVGGGLIYGIANFFSYIVYFLVDMVYTPMFRGVVTQVDVFEIFCPFVRLGNTQFVEVTRYKEPNVGYGIIEVLPEGWNYLLVLAALAVALMALALWLYKKRQLERAGDLMATPILEPVFMVVYSLVAAAAFQGTNQLFSGQDESMYLFLMAGLAVGWFTGRMLVERQVKVITNLKNCLGFLALALTLAASLVIAALDPFGIEVWTPEVEDIQSVHLSTGYRGELTLTDPEEMEDGIRIHQLLVEHLGKSKGEMLHETQQDLDGEKDHADMFAHWFEGAEVSNLTIRYKMKTGWYVERNYQNSCINLEGYYLLRDYMSSIPAVFSNFSYLKDADDLLALAENAYYFQVNSHALEEPYMTKEAIQELLECVIADCEAGTMAQNTSFHPEPVLTIYGSEEYGPQYLHHYSVDIMLDNEKGSLYFNVYADSENTLAWLEKTGVTQKIQEAMEAGLDEIY